jgi:hypothetical protein
LTPPVVHELGGVLDRVVRPDGDHGGGHQVARGDPARLCLVSAVQDAAEYTGLAVEGFLGQHVGLGDDADHLPSSSTTGTR